ncbi:hypothetical protein SESBI_18657 [Sesbania bispinosa]|nr:hypothetical protein SESBI_18657 [Sesbania bispinosa]
MDSLFSLTPKLRSFNCSPFQPLFPSINPTSFHFNTLRPTSTSCSQSPSTSNPHDSRRNPTWVSFPLVQTIKKVATLRAQKRVSDGEGEGCYLQNGGLGVALLSVTANAKLRISPFVATLAANPTFVSGLVAWMLAQSIKVFLNFFVERKWDLRLLFASGGMPSSHSALCTALTTSVALCHGVADSLFPVCLGFSLIVMYDAIGVRRHAGMQAEVLNMIVADLFQGHPISERKLKELLGHTPSQVFAGALLGFLVACICCQACVVGT